MYLQNSLMFYASIFQFEGQVSVFNILDKNGTKDLITEIYILLSIEPGLIPNCAEGGVLGVLPGIIGSLQSQ